MRRAILAVAGVLVLAGSAVRAHHSYSGFFDPRERTVSVEGTLEELLYANPHIVMKIRAADSTVYTVTWQAVTWAERNAGITKGTFAVGDRLVVVGAPARDAASHAVTQVRELRRPSDGWTWKSNTAFAQPS